MMKTMTILINFLLTLMISSLYAEESIESFNNEYYVEVCKRFIACADNPSVAEMAALARIKDVKSCVKAMTMRDKQELWKAALDNNKVIFNPKSKAACFAGIAKKSCGSMAFGVRKPSGIKGCESVIQGTIDDFKNCSTHLECKSVDASCAGGKCERPRGLLCGEEVCAVGQYCDVKEQRCGSPKAIGQSCVNFSECKSGNCTDGLCAAGATVAKPGGSCEINVCPLGEACDGKLCKPY